MRRKYWVVILCAAMGCATQPTDQNMSSQESVRPMQPAAAIQPTAIQPATIQLGHSVKGAPITMQIFGAGGGNGGPTIFFMAGIHGNEGQSVQLADQMIAWITQHPEQIAGKRVAILRVANPDGFAANRRVNANGVDLNRNFPAKNYEASRKYGNAASSQPETQAIIAALDQLQPRLIISVHSIDGGRQCNNYDGPGQQTAELMGKYNHYPAEATIGYPTPGSMGSFAGIDRQIPMITLELPDEKMSDQAFVENREAVMGAIEGTK
jgi:murein peptide amidase A